MQTDRQTPEEKPLLGPLKNLSSKMNQDLSTPLVLSNGEKKNTIKKKYGNLDLSLEVMGLPILKCDDPASKHVNAIVSQYLIYTCNKYGKSPLSYLKIKERLNDFFQRKVTPLYKQQVSWNKFQENIYIYAKMYLDELQNESFFLREAYERLNILRSATQLQLLLLENQSEWTAALFNLLVSLGEDREQKNLTLVELLSFLKGHKKITAEDEELKTISHQIIPFIFGDGEQEGENIINFLSKWIVTEDNFLNQVDEVVQQLQLAAKKIYIIDQ